MYKIVYDLENKRIKFCVDYKIKLNYKENSIGIEEKPKLNILLRVFQQIKSIFLSP